MTPSGPAGPPGAAARVLEWLLPWPWSEEVATDLAEEYASREAGPGRWWWYWREVVSVDTLRLAWELRTRGGDRAKGGGMGVADVSRGLGYGVRTAVRRPGFALAVSCTLALGIGASATIFALIDGILLSSLPFPEAERIDLLRGVTAEGTPVPVPYPVVRDWEEGSRSYAALSAYRVVEVAVGGESGPVPATGELVESTYRRILGVDPARGRFLESADEVPNAAPVVVISDGLWRSVLGGDPAALGGSLRIDGAVHTVVGIMPAGFRGLSLESDLWLVPAAQPQGPLDSRSVGWLSAVGLLSRDAGDGAVRADLAALSEVMAASRPDHIIGVRRQPLAAAYRGAIGPLLALLSAAVALLLLIVAANVANLQIARGISRTRELAVRRALGASGLRLAGEFVAEGLVLAGAGGLGGLLLAVWSTRALVPLLPADAVPAYASIGINVRVLLVVLALAAAMALVFGVVPLAGRRDVAADLSAGGRTDAIGGRTRPQSVLVVAELALAMVTLFATGVVVRSLGAKLAEDPGFRYEDVLVARLAVSGEVGEGRRWLGLTDALLDRLRSLPDVSTAAISSDSPLRELYARGSVERDGAGISYFRHRVSPDYFALLDLPLLRGRMFDGRDGPEGPPAVVISEALARRLWPERDPLGKRFPAEDGPVVVGIVADARTRSLDLSSNDATTRHDIYVPIGQRPGSNFDVLVRTERPAAAFWPDLRRIVAELDGGTLVYRAEPMALIVSRETARDRLGASLLGLFAAISLTLAVVGTYALIAFTIGLRRREFAIRMAIGATGSDIARMVLRRGLRLILPGIGIGALLAIAATPALARVVYRVGPLDPLALAGAALLLLGVGVAASLAPARRAAATEPQQTLRTD